MSAVLASRLYIYCNICRPTILLNVALMILTLITLYYVFLTLTAKGNDVFASSFRLHVALAKYQEPVDNFK